jgi:hypothetical protein
MERVSTMDTNQEQGGIQAKHIQADNIVSGTQIQGGDPQQAAALVQLAQAIRRGEISADEIIAQNIVTGLQYISDPAQASAEDLRQEVMALRARVEQAFDAHEFADPADAEDTRESLAAAETELSKPHPSGNRIIRRLDEANTILTKSAQAAETAGKLGAMVLKLAPVAAAVWQIAQRIFGG